MNAFNTQPDGLGIESYFVVQDSRQTVCVSGKGGWILPEGRKNVRLLNLIINRDPYPLSDAHCVGWQLE